MKNKDRLIRAVSLGVLILASFLMINSYFPAILMVEENKTLGKTEGFLALVKPAFAQSTSTFPEDEAGISAYVNVGQSIDLSKVKAMLRGIRAEGDTYVIGIVELTGLPEEEFPQVYVSSDGWIVPYYSKYAPTSRIVQWYGYGGGKITTTTLEDTIAKICIKIGIDFSGVKGNIKYYHFKYPEATTLLIAVDTMASESGPDTFIFSIPFSVVCYEASWSHCIRGLYKYADSIVKIDGEEISRLKGDQTLIGSGYLKESQLVQDKAHTVSISLIDVYSGYENFVGVAVTFVYR